MWDRVPDPVSAAGMDLAELQLRAAAALTFGSAAPRAVALAEAALQSRDRDSDAGAAGADAGTTGRMAWMQQHGRQAFAAYDAAVRLLADRPA